MAVNAIRRYQ